MKNEWGQMLSRAKTAPLKLCKGSPDVLCGILQIFSFEEQNKHLKDVYKSTNSTSVLDLQIICTSAKN